MALGNQPVYEQEVQDSGVVTMRAVPREPVTAPVKGADFRRHFTLAGGFAAGNPYRIVVDVPIKLISGQPFTKFGLLILTAHKAYIGFDRDVARDPAFPGGIYDWIHPGAGHLEERTEPSGFVSIVFPIVPPDPVEVYMYGGTLAQPT